MSPEIFYLLLILCFILLCGILGILIFLLKRGNTQNNSQEISLLQNQLQALGKSIDTRLSESNKQVHSGLSETLKNTRELGESSNKNIEAITKKLTELDETNKQIQQIGGRLEGLENILKNPKRRGNLGEYFLSELLKNVFSESQYQLQYSLSSGIVDAAIFIGETIIPLDAKFPQENYEKLITSEDEYSVKLYSGELKKDIKKRIDETAKYILPEESTSDFAFMLIPAEGLYYDIFINKIGDTEPTKLIEYGFSKKVIICSPSGFYAYLQTVIQGMKSLKIEEQAREIQKYVAKLSKDLDTYKDTFEKLGNSLGTTVNHYNKARKRFEIIDTDIIKINPNIVESEKKLLDVDTPIKE